MISTQTESASRRWQRLSPIEQLANIGSEVERAISWRQKGDRARFEQAFTRMLELLDLTMEDTRWRGSRLKELTRVREELCNLLTDEPVDGKIIRSLRNYFLYFGILARAHT